MRVHRSSIVATTIAVLTLPGLSGCGSLLRSSEPVEQLYTLNAMRSAESPAAPGAAAEKSAVAGALLVSRPSVQPGLATPRMALRRSDNRFDYFADSRWTAPLPQVIAAFAAETINAAGRFERVLEPDRAGGAARFELQLSVRHFEADYARGDRSNPTAHVAFDCWLITTARRQPLGSCSAEARVEAAANRMGAIVKALEAAAQQAMQRVIDQAAAAAQNVDRPELSITR